MSYIYGLRCECGCAKTEIRYIGQTVLPLHTRLTNHRSQSRFGTLTPVYNWMRKHGEFNIRIELLEATDTDTLSEREVWWIANTTGLLNVAKGGMIGDSLRGSKRPDISVLMTGSSHPATHLTEEDVRDIRKAYTGTRGETSIFAKQHGMTVSAMSDLIRGITWKHVEGAADNQGKIRVRLREEDVRAIRNRRSAGDTLKTLADEYKTSETNIMYISQRKTWKHVD